VRGPEPTTTVRLARPLRGPRRAALRSREPGPRFQTAAGPVELTLAGMPTAFTYRRSELYQQVWAEPIRTIAKRMGLSDVGLAKMCRKHGIPLPKRGHWARVAAGYFDEPPPLPPLKPGEAEEWTVVREDQAPRKPRTEPSAQIWIPAKTPPEITVRATLEGEHRLVGSAHARLSRLRPDGFGFVHYFMHACLDICVSPDELDRALRIMDAVIRGCEARGFRVEVTPVPRVRQFDRYRPERDQQPNVTRVLVDGEWICLRLWERRKREPVAPPKPPRDLRGEGRERWIQDHRPSPKHAPSGVLELGFRLDELRPTWKDYPRRPLELQLDEVLAGLAALPGRARAARAEAQRIRELDEAAAEARRHQEFLEAGARLKAERKEREERRLDDEVIASLERWRLARDLRAYAGEARRLAAEGRCRITPGSELDRRVSRALEIANRVDPLAALLT
jgi:hypothetical protein